MRTSLIMLFTEIITFFDNCTKYINALKGKCRFFSLKEGGIINTAIS
jgi:hypothetical protein